MKLLVIYSFKLQLRQKASPCPSLVPQRIQNAAEDPLTRDCAEVACACEPYTVGLDLELRLVIRNKVARNRAKEITASAPKPISIVVSVVVVVNVDVRIKGGWVMRAVAVVTLTSVMIE